MRLNELADEKVFSTQGTGLFTMGVTAFSFAPPATFTPRAEELYKKAQYLYTNVDAKSNLGLKEMYKLQMQRLEPGKSSPGCEFAISPAGLRNPARELPIHSSTCI